MTSAPQFRRFQFSLLAAIVAMILAGVAIGVYIRWPYYVTGRLLDEAEGAKSFDEWPAVRSAFLNDRLFRDWARQPHARARIEFHRGDNERIVTLFGDAGGHGHGQESWQVRFYGNNECYVSGHVIPGTE